MTTYVMIPVRMTSTRFPKKFLQMIGDKPLVQHVYDNAAKAGFDTRIICDDADAFAAGCTPGTKISQWGDAEAGRPIHTGTDRISSFLYATNIFREDDIIVNVQGDLPFVDPEHIHSALDALNSGPDVACGTIMTYMDPNKQLDPNTVKCIASLMDRVVSDRGPYHPYNCHWFLRNSMRYGYQHIGVYAYKVSDLVTFFWKIRGAGERSENLEQLRWIEQGKTIRARIVPVRYRVPEVNTPEDLEVARSYYDTLRQGILDKDQGTP